MTSALRLVEGPAPLHEYDPLIDTYLEWARDLRGLRENTLRVRRSFLIGVSLFLGKALADATEEDLLRWEREKVAGRAPESRRAYLSHLRAWYRWAVKARHVAVDPTGCLTQPKLVQGVPRPVSDHDFESAVGLARPKMRLWLLLGGFCGLRCQEIAGLHWSDLTTTAEGTTLLVRDGKGGRQRVVPVPSPVLRALVEYGRKRTGPMFYGLDAKQVTARSVSSGINGYLKRMGIGVTAHQFRHRYATTAYRLTKDIRLVQELLGHSTPTTTARYAAFDQSQTVTMVAAMEEQWADVSTERA